MKNINLLRLVFIVLLLLIIPFLLTLFTDNVNWTAGDFAVAGALLFSAGLMIELVIKMVKNKDYRAAIIFAVIILFILFWAEIAVGIFGTPLGGS